MIRSIVAILVVLFNAPINSARCSDKAELAKQKLTVVGKVVAYSLSATDLVSLTFVPNSRVLIVRIEKRIGGREESRYIKVMYRYWHNEPALPKEMFDGKGQWRFVLKREKECDGSIRELVSKETESKPNPLPGLKRTSDSETENIPEDISLPCYELRPGGFKHSGNKR